MQVGSSIQAHNSSGAYESSLGVENSGEIIQANAENNSVWGPKKGKPGLFARLLDGLTGKTKKTAAGSVGNDSQNNVINTQELADSVLAETLLSEKNGKLLSLAKNNKHGLLARGEQINAESENVLYLNAKEGPNFLYEGLWVEDFSPDMPQTDALPKEGLLAGADLTAEQLIARQPAAESATLIKDQVAFTAIETDAKQQDLFNVEGADDTETGNALFRQHENRGRAAVDLFSPRNQESRFAQFTGEPRPGLVDAMGLERGTEAREGARKSENRGKRTDKLNIEVRDFRTGETRPNTPEAVQSTSSVNFRTERVDVDIPVDLTVNGGRAIGEKALDTPIPKTGGFEDALARELRENLNTDIVRQASVVLRNGGEGIIRLSLRPETLGNVKIRLEMTENKITGHIIVESSEAFRAFERELPVLEKAFQDSGFSETNLDMFMAQDNGNYNPKGREDGEFPQITPGLAVSKYESETEIREISSEVFADMPGRASVNLLI